MIPYEVDPSLHTEVPHEPVLDDGYSKPEAAHEAPSNAGAGEPSIPDKSDF